MDEIRKIRNFDNNLKKYEDRKKHVSDVLNDVDVDTIIRESLASLDHTYSAVEGCLEDLGTYLLKSSDIESERKIENSFYQREKDYHKKAIWKNSKHVDLSIREDLMYTNMLDHVLDEDYLSSLFHPSTITLKEKRNVLKVGIAEINKLTDDTLIGRINYFFDSQIEKAKSGKDLLLLNYAAKGLSDKEISDKLNIPRPTISRNINQIIERNEPKAE